MNLNTKRAYVVLIVALCQNANIPPEVHEISLGELITSTPKDFEFIYALRDMIDDVLDMEPGAVMPFQPKRDNRDFKGVIIRKDNCPVS